MEESVETRDRIKAAARKLFAERGVEAVTVREIIAAAGAKNGGSLNYYFRSKEGLIQELLSDVFRLSGEGWLDGLAALEKSGGPKSVRDVIAVLVNGPTPYIRDLSPDSEPTATRFLASVLFTRRREVRDMMERMNYSVFRRLLGYIQQLRPDIPAPVMQQRLIFLAWYLVSAQSAHEAYLAQRRKSDIWAGANPLENLVDTATGLIEAPVAEASLVPANEPRTRTAPASSRKKKVVPAETKTARTKPRARAAARKRSPTLQSPDPTPETAPQTANTASLRRSEPSGRRRQE